jgi:hypothetical protein
MRLVNNYFRTLKLVDLENGTAIHVLGTVHCFWDGSSSETHRAYNAALATGRSIVVYKKLRRPYAHVPAVGEVTEDNGHPGTNGVGGKENNWL